MLLRAARRSRPSALVLLPLGPRPPLPSTPSRLKNRQKRNADANEKGWLNYTVSWVLVSRRRS